jgi:hypothetical protein
MNADEIHEWMKRYVRLTGIASNPRVYEREYPNLSDEDKKTADEMIQSRRRRLRISQLSPEDLQRRFTI